MEAVIEQKRASTAILEQYVPADTYFIANEGDKRLFPIRVNLPSPPPIEDIDGYGLPAKEQKFKRQEIPTKLQRLIRETDDENKIYDILDAKRDYYKREIEWIKLQWRRRLEGYWFFLNGKPTYIDGWHYVYVNFWYIDVGLPKYRSRDRKFFLFARYCYESTDAYYPYKVINSVGKNVYFSDEDKANIYARENGGNVLSEGYYVDFGRRVCFGFNYPKHRREGATYKSEIINYLVTTSYFNAWGGIQSMDGSSAGKTYRKHLVAPWRRLIFFFRPITQGISDPKKMLEFIPKDVSGKQYLGGGITYSETAKKEAYDGDKLVFLHNDECGKTTLEAVDERWIVQKKCLSQGNGFLIHALAINTSTVGEMEKGGGTSFFRLCEDSHYENRDEIGQTVSGLYNFFIPAYDGLDGFIDIYGESIIADPSEDDLWRIPNPVRDKNGNLMGAKRYLSEKLMSYLENPTVENMKKYEEEIRLHPTSWDDCFITGSSSIGFNLIILVRRITELKFQKGLTFRGNFVWKDNIPDTEVIWIDDPYKGKWIRSLEIPPSQRNKFYMRRIMDDAGKIKMARFPTDPDTFIHSADPFKFLRTSSKRQSKGGGACFYKRDMTIDNDMVSIDQWISHRFVITYLNRVGTPAEFAEDMLMQNLYMGGLMNPEINFPIVWSHYVERGYDGYLFYEMSAGGVLKKTPGFSGLAGDQQSILQCSQQYIELHGMRERHIDFLEECKEIKNITEMTFFDLLTACGGCLKALNSKYSEYLKKPKGSGVDIASIRKKKRY